MTVRRSYLVLQLLVAARFLSSSRCFSSFPLMFAVQHGCLMLLSDLLGSGPVFKAVKHCRSPANSTCKCRFSAVYPPYNLRGLSTPISPQLWFEAIPNPAWVLLPTFWKKPWSFLGVVGGSSAWGGLIPSVGWRTSCWLWVFILEHVPQLFLPVNPLPEAPPPRFSERSFRTICSWSALPPWLSFSREQGQSVKTSFGTRFLFLAGPADLMNFVLQEFFKLSDPFSEAFHIVL